jgi:hypothetical protein
MDTSCAPAVAAEFDRSLVFVELGDRSEIELLAGAGTREERNERYRDAMAAAHDRYLALLHNFWYVRAFERF